ncbi:hypothetical protein B0H14DRAFT_3039326, partial [Mycena olivaceomarginata]
AIRSSLISSRFLMPGADATTHSAIQHCLLLALTSVLLLFSVPTRPSPGTWHLFCKQRSLSCSRYTSLQTAVHSI